MSDLSRYEFSDTKYIASAKIVENAIFVCMSDRMSNFTKGNVYYITSVQFSSNLGMKIFLIETDLGEMPSCETDSMLRFLKPLVDFSDKEQFLIKLSGKLAT